MNEDDNKTDWWWDWGQYGGGGGVHRSGVREGVMQGARDGRVGRRHWVF